jgi:hypothetical protein
MWARSGAGSASVQARRGSPPRVLGESTVLADDHAVVEHPARRGSEVKNVAIEEA